MLGCQEWVLLETARNTARRVTAATAQLRNHLFPENGTVVL